MLLQLAILLYVILWNKSIINMKNKLIIKNNQAGLEQFFTGKTGSAFSEKEKDAKQYDTMEEITTDISKNILVGKPLYGCLSLEIVTIIVPA